MAKKGVEEFEKALKDKNLFVAMLAPSFVGQFEYPSIINQLKDLGFDKVVELTFGAKMINRCYHSILKDSKQLLIASVCPGVVETVKERFPQYKKNLMPFDSPMIAMAKICKKTYPKHKVVFISPCEFKKIEGRQNKEVDFIIDNEELEKLFKKYKIKKSQKKAIFDKFYNDYTKIYPIVGGLSKSAHLKGVLKPGEEIKIDGIAKLIRFFEKPDKKVRFIDATFCVGACLGGPHTNKRLTVQQKKQRVLDYFEKSKDEDIPETRKGIIDKAEGINFCRKY